MDFYSPHRSKLHLVRPRKKRRILLPILLALAVILLGFNITRKITFSDTEASTPRPSTNGDSLQAKIKKTSAGESAKTLAIQVSESVVQSGQTASDILDDYFSPAEIHNLSIECRDVFPLERLRAGNTYRLFTLGNTGDFCGMEYEIDSEEKLAIRRTPRGVQVGREPILYEVETNLASGSITSSLFEAVAASGEQDEFAIRLAEIFAWDVDFVRDLRIGDSFQALVEKRYRNGEFANYGRILAARFTNNGKTFQAYLFTDQDGRSQYYDEDGQSVRKAFLKAPLSFRRISSGYSKSRMHPILKVRRPHKGIDYAAPSGTPIKTVGDGTVIVAGYSKAAGRYVKIRHNSVYETVYNHMSRFGKGIRKGVRVTQGQVIGYVGSTGYSTGPHLDFRMKKNGQHVNPLTIESPSCEPVPQADMDRYITAIAPLQARLDAAEPLHASTVSTSPEPAD